MAVVLIEGFDHLSNSLITTKGWSSGVSSLVTGRYPAPTGSAPSMAANINFPDPGTTKILPSSYTTLILGIAFYNLYDLTFGTANGPIELGNSGGPVVVVSLNSNRKLQVSNSTPTIIATGTTNINVNTWYYMELKIFINGASGTCEVHLDGATEIASTVGNFGSTALDRITIQTSHLGPQIAFDDVYICDTTGAGPRNTFLGPARVITPIPNGVGNYSQWTPNGASPNYACVDESPPDGDTTFVSSLTPGQLDSYQVGDVPLGATIFGVQPCIYARKDDANTRQIAGLIRQAGTDYIGNTFTESASYVDFTQIYNQDPTGVDWTVATFNADEFGQKEIA